MPVELKGSCHCGAVSFTVEAYAPVPYMLCLCSICRKTGGVGGSINLGAYANSLKVEGKENITIYNARKKSGTEDQSRYESERSFCNNCGTMLWNYDKAWPDLIHPFASAIDTELIDPSELPNPQPMCVIKMNSKPKWVRLPEGDKNIFDDYPDLSLEDWHKKAGAFPQ